MKKISYAVLAAVLTLSAIPKVEAGVQPRPITKEKACYQRGGTWWNGKCYELPAAD